MKKLFSVLLVVLMFSSITAYSSNDTGEGNEKDLKFAWINGAIGNPVYNLYDEGTKAAAKDYDITVDILGVVSGSGDSAKYAEQIEIAINAGYDGLITYCSETGAAVDALKKAKAAGIPIVDVMMAAGGEETYDTFIGLDAELMGQMLADNIAEACGKKGKLLYTQTRLSLELQNTIRKACYDHLAENYPDMEFVANDELTIDSTKQAEVYTNLFTAYPDVVGLVVCDATGGPNGARLAKEMGIKDFKVACIDDTDDCIALIKSGDVTSTIAQGGKGMLYDAVRLLYENATEGKKLPKFLPIPMFTVTIDNVDTYQNEMLLTAHLKGTEWDY